MEETNPEVLSKVWSAVLAEAKKSTSESYFAAFLQDTKLLSVLGGVATVAVKNVFIKAQIVARFDVEIKKALDNHNLKVSSIDYVTSSRKKQKAISDIKVADPTSQSRPTSLASSQNNTSTNLNERYSFENFVNGFSTQEVFAACQAVAETPGRQGYNPLFVYGGVGLGKTHLIQATGNTILKTHPNMKVLYITANDFLSDFVDSIRLKSKFDDKYRSFDCLIIDDIQHFSGKERTQDSFFNTFNSLYQNNKQIILSSDRPPSAIKTLANRLRSRFEMGLIFDIQLPDTETRAAIIKAKTSERNLPFDNEL
ncbi:DnaA/Hda family protein, partial [Candidatus Saccharibacteria bacterium]|nr:DnaA/Hda family protein [Candidatus Saccharibacteria bacterium]